MERKKLEKVPYLEYSTKQQSGNYQGNWKGRWNLMRNGSHSHPIFWPRFMYYAPNFEKVQSKSLLNLGGYIFICQVVQT